MGLMRPSGPWGANSGLQIAAHSVRPCANRTTTVSGVIGPGRREIDDRGCILVRPDRFVGVEVSRLAGGPRGKRFRDVLTEILDRAPG